MKSRSKLVAGAGSWCVLIVLIPLVVERFPVVGFLYLPFSPICHQLPERSFFLLGHQLPVCARCTGIYVGVFVGSFLAHLKAPPRGVLVAALIPMVVDGVTQLVFRESFNVLRAATGFIAGVGVAFYVYPALVSRYGE